MARHKSFSRKLYETQQFKSIKSVKKLVQAQPKLKQKLTINGRLLPIDKDIFATWDNETLWLVCRIRSYAFEQAGVHPDLRFNHGFPLETFNDYREVAKKLRYPVIVVVRVEDEYFYIYLHHLFLHGDRKRQWFRTYYGQRQEPKPALLVPQSAMTPVFDKNGNFGGFDEPDYG
ncbi:MAG: hypothetical protein AAGD25_36425 [Cyanobacteria bacterium P01_F01_bin.150]